MADRFRATRSDHLAPARDPYQPIDALRSCRTTGLDPSRSASTKLPFVAYGGLGLDMSTLRNPHPKTDGRDRSFAIKLQVEQLAR
jgi:hypothetical protein